MTQHQSIVNPVISHAEQKYKSKKYQLNLQDPLIFTNRRDGLPIVEWLAKTKGKMSIDKDFMNTPWHCMTHVISCVGGTAFGYLEPCA